jgi:hypothetical protein
MTDEISLNRTEGRRFMARFQDGPAEIGVGGFLQDHSPKPGQVGSSERIWQATR